MNLLKAANYDPGTAVSKSTASLLAMTAIDTTNLRLAITVPSHGMVRFRMRCAITGATSVPAILLGVMNGATVIGRQAPVSTPITASSSTMVYTLDAEFTVSGLTPGAMNVDAAYAVQVVVASTNIKYGGPNTNAGANAWGGFLFEAWDPQPQTTTGQLSVDAGGRVDVAKVAGTAQTARDLGAQLDAAISTRAPSSTALSSATWTNARAALVDNLDAAISTRLATASYSAAPSAATVASAVWEEPLAGHATAGTAGAKLSAAGSSGDPWATALPGSYAAGTAGKILGDKIMASVTGSVGSVTGAVTVGTNNDKTGYSLSAAAVQSIWDALSSALTTVGSIGKRIVDFLDATVSSRSTYAGGDTSGTTTLLGRLTSGRATNLDNLDTTVSSRSTYAGADTAGTTTLLGRLTAPRATALDNLDAAVSSRLAGASYTAPDNGTIAAIAGYVDTEVAAIKGVVDKLDTAMELNGAVYRFTAGALALAPTAAGGSGGLDAAGVRAAIGLAAADLDTQLAGINAKTTNLPASPASSAQVAAVGDAVAAAGANVAAVKTKTDQLAFTVAGQADVNLRSIQGATIGGAGTEGNPWGPA